MSTDRCLATPAHRVDGPVPRVDSSPPGQRKPRGAGDRGAPCAWLLALLAMAATGAAAEPPAGAPPAVPWSTVDAGAAVLSADSLRLSATLGQPDVPFTELGAGTAFRLRAGYWLTPQAGGDVIFADGFDDLP